MNARHKNSLAAAPAIPPGHDDADTDAATQRVIPAAGAPAPKTNEPSSVFALGGNPAPTNPLGWQRPATPAASENPQQISDSKAGKSKRVRHSTNIDLAAITIETDVPLPDVKTGNQAVYPELWNKMPAGSMVRLTDRQANGLMSHVKKVGGKAAKRKLDNDVTGVWRLA